LQIHSFSLSIRRDRGGTPAAVAEAADPTRSGRGDDPEQTEPGNKSLFLEEQDQSTLEK
jgi:hypothetical protein